MSALRGYGVVLASVDQQIFYHRVPACSRSGRTAVVEKQRYAPQSCCADKSENYSAEQGLLAAEKPSHDVKGKEANAAPVDSTYNGEYQCEFSDHHK